MIRKTAALLSLSFLLTAQVASADTILKFDLGDTGPDLNFQAGVFSTLDDGDAATAGHQDTGIEFTSFLQPLFATIPSGASFTLDTVNAVGTATTTGSLVSQQTEGGTFSIWNEANELLLAAELGEGLLAGSVGVSTGTFFNTEVANYTGGSLLSHVDATPAGISIALANILTDGIEGILLSENNTILPFTADADGLITGNEIPEPATALLLGSAGLAGLIRRRRK